MKTLWLAPFYLLLCACGSDDSSVALGTLERDRISLSAPVSEVIRTLNVTEGQSVQPGDILLTLDSTLAESRLQQRQAELDSARATLDELLAGARREERAAAAAAAEAARASLTEASQRLSRNRTLFKQQMIGQAELDNAVAQHDAAAARLDQAEEQLRQLTNGTRPEKIRQAQAALRAAEARLAAEQKNLDDLTLRAPRAARIDLIAAEAGSRVNAGTPLLTLLANAEPYVRVYVPQSKIAALSVGTEVEVRVEGLPQTLHGRVRNVRAQPAYTPYFALNERDRARLMHLTEIVLNDMPAGLASGLAVEVLLPADASAQGSKP